MLAAMKGHLALVESGVILWRVATIVKCQLPKGPALIIGGARQNIGD
jgi:hypothetical protein